MLESAIMKKEFSKAKKIIKSGKINKKGKGLIYAIRYEQEDIADMLIENNIDVNTKDIYGKTALSWALELDQSKIVKKLILAGAKAESKKSEVWYGH